MPRGQTGFAKNRWVNWRATENYFYYFYKIDETRSN
jgi:hypothetical protein